MLGNATGPITAVESNCCTPTGLTCWGSNAAEVFSQGQKPRSFPTLSSIYGLVIPSTAVVDLYSPRRRRKGRMTLTKQVCINVLSANMHLSLKAAPLSNFNGTLQYWKYTSAGKCIKRWRMKGICVICWEREQFSHQQLNPPLSHTFIWVYMCPCMP